ncbi:MAG: polynucleotide kinase-phosphatase, partial [Deltaproteobacteria bacterium]|nr:polynucleotide kinase-phosphatase [Deltaproteobacteria bacterium]
FLEHPREAFEYFSSAGVYEIICEQKHMGSRAVVIVCRSADAARERFGVNDGTIGICYTRTGRKFLDAPELEAGLLARVHSALTQADFWTRFGTEWVCLDCELMPWSFKAQELLRSQYAAVGSSGLASLESAAKTLALGASRNSELVTLLNKVKSRQAMVTDFIKSYQSYCWSVNSLDDLKLAPFHILATESAVHSDKTHQWHMDEIAEFCNFDSKLLLKTPWLPVNLQDETNIQKAVDWWLELTGSGGEGMVIKPLQFIVQTKKGLIQPAVKCRGREYLRIIYGPEYTALENLQRLRARGLSSKRSLALREFALGIESLQRFVAREPLRRVHECVFGVLALESEPVDPRL